MHYYQFNISDFTLHTAHLTLEEEGVYRRLLDYYYDTESPIPKETNRVVRRLRLVNYEHIVDSILDEFFILEHDGWHNLRADIEIESYKNKAKTAQENGKKGGRPKKNSGIKTQSVILANPEKTGSKANQELETKNQEPNIPPISPKGESDEIVDFSIFNLSQEYIDEIIRIRKKNSKSAKVGKITQRIANMLAKEINLALDSGFTIDQVLDEWESRGWQSFKSEWFFKDKKNNSIVNSGSNLTKNRSISQQLNNRDWAN